MYKNNKIIDKLSVIYIIYMQYIYNIIYAIYKQAPHKLCLSGPHSTVCGDCKRNIHENTRSV